MRLSALASAAGLAGSGEPPARYESALLRAPAGLLGSAVTMLAGPEGGPYAEGGGPYADGGGGPYPDGGRP
jgi:hypothetical protein